MGLQLPMEDILSLLIAKSLVLMLLTGAQSKQEDFKMKHLNLMLRLFRQIKSIWHYQEEKKKRTQNQKIIWQYQEEKKKRKQNQKIIWHYKEKKNRMKMQMRWKIEKQKIDN